MERFNIVVLTKRMNRRDETRQCQKKILTDPWVVEPIKKLHLSEDVVIQCDTWPYGADKDSDLETPKYIQALLYARAPHNQHAFPLPISLQKQDRTDGHSRDGRRGRRPEP